jgi:hypothetical protein
MDGTGLIACIFEECCQSVTHKNKHKMSYIGTRISLLDESGAAAFLIIWGSMSESPNYVKTRNIPVLQQLLHVAHAACFARCAVLAGIS